MDTVSARNASPYSGNFGCMEFLYRSEVSLSILGASFGSSCKKEVGVGI